MPGYELRFSTLSDVLLGHLQTKVPIAERAPRCPTAFSGVTAHQYCPGSRPPGGERAVPTVSTGVVALPSTCVASAGSAATVTTYLTALGTGSQRSRNRSDG